MTKIPLPDYFEIKTRKADSRGRLSLGPGYADKEVTVIVLDAGEERD